MSLNPKISKANVAALHLLENDEAVNNITVVTNPGCKPCFAIHEQLEQYIDGCYSNISIDLVFAVKPSLDTHSDYYKVAKRIMALRKEQGKNSANKAIKDWFASDKMKTFEDWQINYPVENEDVEEELHGFEKWSDMNQINYTPTVFFNGRQLPKYYKVSDIKYLIT